MAIMRPVAEGIRFSQSAAAISAVMAEVPRSSI